MSIKNTLDNSKTISFTEEENRQIYEIIETLKINDSNSILDYGAKIQKQIATLPDLLLDSLKEDSSNEIKNTLSYFISELSKFNTAFDVFKNPIKHYESLVSLQKEYTILSAKISSLSYLLDEQIIVSLYNTVTLKNLFKKGVWYYRKLCVLIEAGNRKIKSVKANELVALKNSSTNRSAEKKALLIDICKVEYKIAELEKTKSFLATFIRKITFYYQNLKDSTKEIQTIFENTIPKWQAKSATLLNSKEETNYISLTLAFKPDEIVSATKTLSNQLSSLVKIIETTCESRKVFDKFHLLGEDIQKHITN